MRHRKGEHKVPLCKAFLKNNCGFSADDCYHTHAKSSCAKPQPTPAQCADKKTSNPTANGEGFWDAPVNLAPPLVIKTSQKGPTQAKRGQHVKNSHKVPLLTKPRSHSARVSQSHGPIQSNFRA